MATHSRRVVRGPTYRNTTHLTSEQLQNSLRRTGSCDGPVTVDHDFVGQSPNEVPVVLDEHDGLTGVGDSTELFDESSLCRWVYAC